MYRSHRDRDTDRENQRSLQRYHDQRPGAAASDDNISHTVRKAELQDILHQKLRRDEDYRIRNEDTVAHSMRGVKDSERHDHSSRFFVPCSSSNLLQLIGKLLVASRLSKLIACGVNRCISPVYEKRKLDRRDADGHQVYQASIFLSPMCIGFPLCFVVGFNAFDCEWP